MFWRGSSPGAGGGGGGELADIFINVSVGYAEFMVV